MKKRPSESQEPERVKTIRFQDLEPLKEYVVAEDTRLFVGSGSRRTVTLVVPKGTSFGIPAEVFSEIQIVFRNNVQACLLTGALNTDEIKVFDK